MCTGILYLHVWTAGGELNHTFFLPYSHKCYKRISNPGAKYRDEAAVIPWIQYQFGSSVQVNTLPVILIIMGLADTIPNY